MTIRDVLELSPKERVRFVEAVRESVVEFSEAMKLSDAQRRELNARLDALHANPAASSPWGLVKTPMTYNA